MQGSRRMRLDLRGFQKSKKAGLLLIVLVIAGALTTALLLGQEQKIANYYMSVDEYVISSSTMLEKIISSSTKPVAVMFESPTCPTCKQMHPHWAVLERQSSTLPVQFYHIVFSPATEEAFRRYRVTDTPTFIVFVGGQPVARHVGAFGGDNITSTMLNWALFSAGLGVVADPQKLAEEGLRIFNNRCSSCHGEIGGLDEESLRAWLDSRRGEPDLLAKRLAEALEKNMTLRELYGSYGAISDAVKTMRKYIPDLTSYEIDRLSYLLDYASAILEGK
ncbi:MAG TPA: thioredoxin, partial [Pyrodictium delaneyi]|nr:thioredoxin [Pyrodictium delaneyi]